MASGLVHAINDLIAYGRSYFDLHRKKDRWSQSLGSAHRRIDHNWYWEFGRSWSFDNPFPQLVCDRISFIRETRGPIAAEEEQVRLSHDSLDRTWDVLSKERRKYWEAFFIWLLFSPDLLRSWAGVDVVKGEILRRENDQDKWHSCPSVRDEYQRLRAYAEAVKAKDPELRRMLSAMGLATFTKGIQGTGGPVALMNAAQSVNPGTYTAKTDGFIIGYVWSPGNIRQLSHGIAFGSSGSANAAANGGTYCSLDSNGNKWWSASSNAFMLPVNKGANWSISNWQDNANQENVPMAFWWVPVGTPSPGVETFTWIGEAPEVEVPRSGQFPPKIKPNYVPELVEIIQAILGRRLDSKDSNALSEVLTKMNKD